MTRSRHGYPDTPPADAVLADVSWTTGATRGLPWSEEAEQAVLGGLLLDGADALRRAHAAGLVAAWFARPGHATLYAALVTLLADAPVVDPVVLFDRLDSKGELEAVGGRDYVGDLADHCVTSANIAHHVGILRERASRRALILAADEAAHRARVGDGEPTEIAAALQAAVTPVTTAKAAAGFVHVRDVLWEAMEAIEHAANPDRRPGVRCGFPELDDVFNGWRRGELVIQCHVSGHGKTAWCFNVAKNAAMDDGVHTAVVLAEGTKRAGATRLLNMTALVSTVETRSGRFDGPEAMARLTHASAQLARTPIYLDDAPMPSVQSVASKLRWLKTKHPELELVVVDYLQLLQAETGSKARDEGRARELDLIANGLKGLAKELEVVILATAQPNAKGIEERSDKKPTLRDIAWSQGIRNAADFILLGYMPHMYGPVPRHTLEIEVAKGRDLPTFAVSLEWEGRYLLVDSPARRRLLHDRERAAHRATLKVA